MAKAVLKSPWKPISRIFELSKPASRSDLYPQPSANSLEHSFAENRAGLFRDLVLRSIVESPELIPRGSGFFPKYSCGNPGEFLFDKNARQSPRNPGPGLGAVTHSVHVAQATKLALLPIFTLAARTDSVGLRIRKPANRHGMMK